MSWSLKWNDKIESGFYDNLMQKGLLKEEDHCPNITPFEFYTDAFAELNTCRSVGMSAGAIPFSEIKEYASIYVDVEDFDEFLYLIRRMDKAYLDKSRKESNGH